MKALNRNKQVFYYALYDVTTVDDYGNPVIAYGSPVKTLGNISSATGSTQTEMFGSLEGYDKTIVIVDATFPMDEYSVLWVDTTPELDDEGNTDTPYDYIVKRVARSLNSVSYAIAKVSVNV